MTNSIGAHVTVIDGANNATSVINTGSSSNDIAVNTTTNKIYLSPNGGSTITEIDGVTNLSMSINDLDNNGPKKLAVDEVTNKVYIIHKFSTHITVLERSSDTSTILPGDGGDARRPR